MNENQNPMAPPLDMDLGTVDTSMPLLKDDNYQFQIVKAELKPTTDNTGRYISIDAKTTMPATSVKGEPLGAGVHVFANVMINPTGKSNWEIVQRGVASLVQSIEGGVPGAKLSNVDQWVPGLVGRLFKAKTGYVPAGVKNGKSFREKNEITLWLKA
jgi:hypothetical protein